FRLAATPETDGSAPADIAIPPRGAKLSEHGSKRLLAAAGLKMPPETLVTWRDDLHDAVARAGLPLAMKIQSPDIAHKSEIGGVRLGVASEDEAMAAFDDLLAQAKRQRPDAAIEGVLVGPMAKPGTEIIVGTVRDATFGPMVMVGFGGVTTELFRDVVYRSAPVGADEAVAMLDALKAAPLLHGFRGAPKADVAALSELISRVSQLAARYRDEIAEIEINPVRVHRDGEGVTVVDALVVPAR
ncbi:MAG: acetate--CoA ligase family protein, partial [Xanthobacteraceae bacterium]